MASKPVPDAISCLIFDSQATTEPGGYLQWSEHNFFTTTIGAAHSNRQHSAMDKLNQALLASKAGQ